MKFMSQIEEHVSYIEMLLDDLSKYVNKKDSESIDNEYVKAEIEYAAEEILKLQEEIIIFSQKFNCRFDYYVHRYLNYSLEALTESLLFFSKKTNEASLEKIKDDIFHAYFLWTEKFEEDFSCWVYRLMKKGLYITKNSAIFDEDGGTEAFILMMQNALFAESLYFSLERNKSQATLVPIKNDLMFNRATNGNTRTIDAQRLNGRQLISVNISSVSEAMQGVQPIDLTLQARLADVLDWHITGKTNGSRETVLYGDTQIKYQHQPLTSQLANMHTSGVGRYGTGKSGKIPNILEIVNTLVQGDPEKEKALGKLLIRYKRGDGGALSENALKTAGIQLPPNTTAKKRLIAQFQKAAYLICFQEVYRRKNQGYQQVDGEIKKIVELPFGLALACLLKLIVDGHLRFANVLDADCEYGVFTGQSVMGRNLEQTIHKFNELFTLFVGTYAQQDYDLFEYNTKVDEMNVAFTPQYFHELLKETDGGNEDSENEDYDASPVKDQNTKELERLMKNLKVTPPKF